MSRTGIAAFVLVVMAACRGEKVPRDYQNNPPAMTHPVTTSSQTPTAQGMPGPTREPNAPESSGTAAPNQPVNPLARTTTIRDQAPGAGTTGTTGTPGTVVTSTTKTTTR